MRLTLRALAPAGPKSRLSVLIFHRVLATHDPLQPGEPTVAEFEQRMRWVKNWFSVIPLSEAVRRLRDRRLPERPLSITFDDGYADNHDNALPVLRRLGLPATFFIASGYLDGGRMFNDTVIEVVRGAAGPVLDLSALGLGVHPVADDGERRAAISAMLARVKYLPLRERTEIDERLARMPGVGPPGGLMMSTAQVAALHAAGMEVGAHTVMHPILQRTDGATARSEIAHGRARLQQIIEAPVGLFAYPNGQPTQDYGSRDVALVRELGFEGAVTTARGAARAGEDVFQIPRFTPWDSGALSFAGRMIQTLASPRAVLL